VKLEQASKVKSWMPTRLNNGEGRVDREATDRHLIRSTGVMSTACEEGGLGNWGRPGTDGGFAPPTLFARTTVRPGDGEGRSSVEAG